jgi:deoxyribodipyrimidine photo-lyase
MVVASYLIKNLNISWQEGEAWFWDTLVDADPASNPISWQWVAGCGADAAPFFRIFNPVTQSEKFDTDGTYIKTWVPELSKLSPPDLYAPWAAGPITLAAAEVTLGETYPVPLVDLKESREAALLAYQGLKEHPQT